MASPTTTRPNGFVGNGSSPQASDSSASDLEERNHPDSSLPRRYLTQQKSPSPPPTRKKVEFSSENLRYNRMMLKQARETNRISGGSGQNRSKNRGSHRPNRAELGSRGVSIGGTRPLRPPRSPAPVTLQSGTTVGIRGGLTRLGAEARPGTTQHEHSHEKECQSASKKRTLDVAPEIFPSPKRRLLDRVSRSPSPHISHRHYEHIALDSSEDELGQRDELGEPSPTPARRLNPPTSRTSSAGKSPVRRFHSPQRQRPSTSSGLALETRAGRKKVAFSPHGSSGHGNGGFSTLFSKARHGTPPSQTGVPKQRRALSVWRLASPPKVDTGGAPEAAIIDVESDEDERSHNRDERSHPLKSVSEVKVEHENRGDQAPTVTETALPIPTEAPQRRTESRSSEKSVNIQPGEPSEQNPIIMCGERQYSEWTGTWDGDARRIPGAGALFPEGYEPLVGSPEPWICPIRDCQTVFPAAWALGGHFSASHRALLLNDNRDGTMSILGKRKFPDPASGRMPALVVSRQPLDPATAIPKASPRKPGRRKKVENRIPLSDVTPKRPKETPVPVPKLLNTPRPRSNSILVIELPSNRSSKHLYSPDKHSQAILRPKENADIREKKDANPDSSSSDESIPHTPIHRRTEKGGDLPVSPQAAKVDDNRDTITRNAASTRRSGRLAKPEPARRPAQPRPASKRPGQAAPESKKPSRKQPASSAAKLARPTPNFAGESSRRADGVAVPPPYTMSDWEIAPGRVRVGLGDESDNIAFSSIYLAHSSTSPLHLTPTISFQLLTIQPGTTVHWWAHPTGNNAEEEEPRTKICSVAQGIVKVKLCGQEFPVGPNGLFKVATGQDCELSSVCYGGAVLHVTCVSEGDE
ncbi:hypothetical protein QBC40DRAFT_233670 [Triangularia verruculosa]|uniref:Uncharacterized protein n=1 Tax=Triangularia verruculosa TaxID=2587418 RepID=A0AAN7ART4_9PEZI|nr:hypothetical protein QBC40DRAFT_233670 [Triangularia verruculosa]